MKTRQQVTTFRVCVKAPGGQVTHKSNFNDLAMAENYYGALFVMGSTRSLQIRRPGEA